MSDLAAAAPTVTEAPLEAAPTGLEAAREVSQKLLEQSLPPDQAKVLRQARAEKAKAKAAEQAAAPAVTEAPAKPAPAAAPEAKTEAVAEAAKPEADVIDFGADDKPAVQVDETPAPDELSPEDLAKLDDKARKAVTDASKEAAKVRKRAQEAESKLAEKDTALAERDQKLAATESQLQEILARGPALAGNEFGRFTNGQQVAAWGNNAQEALALLTAHERAVKAGRASETDAIIHTLPTGDEVELQLASKEAFARRVADAQAWFDTDHKLGLSTEAAKKIEERHQGTQGYKDALAAYTTDPALHTRLPELQRKAALYDTLMARKAMITFPDTAAAATKAAPATEARGSKPASQKTAPLTETPASAPRMAVAMQGDDVATRKSELMERARTATNYDEQQKYLKQAAMLPSAGRTFAQQGSRSRTAA